MPALTIPPGLVPYLTGEKTDYSTHAASITKVNVPALAVMSFIAFLRFYVRFGVLRSPGLDDVFLILALISAILLSASCLVGLHFGLGKHIWNLSTDLSKVGQLTGDIIKSLYGAYLSYCTAITFTKLSIISLYHRVFSRSQSQEGTNPRVLRNILIVTTFVVLSFWIASIFAVIFTCVPVSAAWDYTIQNAKCFPVVKFFYVASGFNIATDILLCFLPFPTLWALKMPVSQRVVLIALFSMGTFACVASICRLTQLHGLGGFDVSYSTVPGLNWSVIEVSVAISCTSLSALRPLANRYLPAFFLPSHSYQNNKSEPSRLVSGSRSKAIEKMRPLASEEALPEPGGITVQRTFELHELKEIPVPGRVMRRATNDSDRALIYTERIFETSSKEGLVQQKR